MGKKVSLTVNDRYNIVTYAYQIPSSTGVYFSFQAFIDKLELSDKETEDYEVKVVDGKVTCNCPERTFEYDTGDLPEIIMTTIANFVADKKSVMEEEAKDHKDDPNYVASDMYKSMIQYLSKLL